MRAIFKHEIVVVGFLVFALLAQARSFGAHSSERSPQGLVPDEATAIRIAEAVFPNYFNADEIAKWRPYHAQLDKKGTWTVYGTLPRGSRGGTPMISVKKKDGRILEVWHSQ